MSGLSGKAEEYAAWREHLTVEGEDLSPCIHKGLCGE